MIDNYIKVSCRCHASQGLSLNIPDFPSDEYRGPLSERTSNRLVKLRLSAEHKSLSDMVVLSWVFPFSHDDPETFRVARTKSGKLQELLFGLRMRPVRSWYRTVLWGQLDLVVVGQCRSEGQVTS